MTTSTKELIKEADRMAAAVRVHSLQFGGNMCELFTSLAQRLRELDKPDCKWHKVGETFDTACNARYRDGAYSTWKTCPNCGGAVKSGGLANDD